VTETSGLDYLFADIFLCLWSTLYVDYFHSNSFLGLIVNS